MVFLYCLIMGSQRESYEQTRLDNLGRHFNAIIWQAHVLSFMRNKKG